jgi:hypothetical protein
MRKIAGTQTKLQKSNDEKEYSVLQLVNAARPTGDVEWMDAQMSPVR